MAQYWLEIASSADRDAFSLTAGGTLAYEVDGSTPVVTLSSAADYGNYARFLSVPTVADAQVRIFSRATGSFAQNASGPALRISGQNGYAFGQRGGTSTTRRIYWTNSTSYNNVNSESTTGGVANDIYAWREFLASGTTLQLRDWTDSRPESAEQNATNSTYSSGFVGFGVPGNGGAGKIYVSIISVGTDGDPAPDGPVGGERQRSRLILTPW